MSPCPFLLASFIAPACQPSGGFLCAVLPSAARACRMAWTDDPSEPAKSSSVTDSKSASVACLKFIPEPSCIVTQVVYIHSYTTSRQRLNHEPPFHRTPHPSHQLSCGGQFD